MCRFYANSSVSCQGVDYLRVLIPLEERGLSVSYTLMSQNIYPWKTMGRKEKHAPKLRGIKAS